MYIAALSAWYVCCVTRMCARAFLELLTAHVCLITAAVFMESHVHAQSPATYENVTYLYEKYQKRGSRGLGDGVIP